MDTIEEVVCSQAAATQDEPQTSEEDEEQIRKTEDTSEVLQEAAQQEGDSHKLANPQTMWSGATEDREEDS